MFNTIDYENALWGKDLYTIRALEVRAEILNEIFPDISLATSQLIAAINEFNTDANRDIKKVLYSNQREFSTWLNHVFYVLNKAYLLAQCYLSHEKNDIPIIKLGDRDINRTALFGAYKNRTDEEFYDVIDNIIFIIVDISLGFNPKESELAILSKYIINNVKKYKKSSISEVINELQNITPYYICEYKNNKDVYFDIVNDLVAPTNKKYTNEDFFEDIRKLTTH